MPRVGIGTGRIVSSYYPPALEEIDKADFDRRMGRYGGKQLDQNTWLLNTTKSYFIPRTYVTYIILRRLKKYYICSIPTDKKGIISQLNMAERLLDVETGDRQGHIRNVMIDVGINAQKIHDPKHLANTYRWWIYPNESDVKQIDDAKSMIVEILGKGTKWGKMKCLIVGGSQEDREKIAADITANFTIKEKRVINNCLIEIVPDNRSYAGCFMGNTDAAGNPRGTPKIAVTKSHVANSDVIIHESIHALRQFDESRDPKLRAMKTYWGTDADLEESLTDGETTARQKPFTRDNYKAGYYHRIKIPKTKRMSEQEAKTIWNAMEQTARFATILHLGYSHKTLFKNKSLATKWDDFKEKEKEEIIEYWGKNKTPSEMVVEDRITFTGSKEKGQKGKRVQKTVLMKYPMTNISHLQMKGRAEAIDTFRELERTGAGTVAGKVTTHVQMYKPDATNATDRIQDEALKRETTGRIRQWQDGKRELVRDGKKHKKPKGKTKKIGPYYTRGGKLSKHPI